MSPTDFILQAGGLVSIDAVPPDDVPTDTVSARSYTHPALGSRVVVRLSPSALSEADDLEMAVLGFDTGTDLGAVGQQKRRALGFPGHAIVHDPERARYALKVVKRFRKAAARVRAKPGFAKSDFEAIAKDLGASVPHFLPSFFEEAGRAFLFEGNPKFAGQMFEKAREAERVHGLTVDEDLRRETFLEFALAGALAIKSLSTYARDLEKSADPATAYAQFRRLSVSRTLGGLPPWSGMSKSLRRLAKRAGLDRNTEDDALIEELIDAPALKKSAAAFWKDYAPSIGRVCARRPEVRAHLLDLFPKSTSSSQMSRAEWLDRLEAWGCLASLDGSGPAAAAPSGGPAAWFGRLLSDILGWRLDAMALSKSLSLLRFAAHRIRHDGHPLPFTNAHGWSSVDFIDLALELGLELASPDRLNLSLSQWAASASVPHLGRNPVHLAAHPELGPKLQAVVGTTIGEAEFDRESAGMSAFLEAKKAWLEARLRACATDGVAGLALTLDLLGEKLSPELLDDCGWDALDRLNALDFSANLTRTFQVGIPDELGWPALEEAVEALAGPDHNTEGLGVQQCFPFVVVHNGVRAIAVGPNGQAGTTDLRIGPKQTLRAIRFVQGQFFVVVWDQSTRELVGSWSHQPDAPFTVGYGVAQAEIDTGWVLPDGALVFTEKAVSAGDTAWPSPVPVCSDGTSAWSYLWRSGGGRTMREFNPRTGEAGRTSMPTWFEDYAQEGTSVDLSSSRLLPWAGSSPLGARDGLIGWRVRVRDPEHPLGASRPAWVAEGIDGRTTDRSTPHGAPWGLLTLPGTDAPRPVVYASAWRSTGEVSLCSPDGQVLSARWSEDQLLECKGQVALLSPMFFHHLTPRNPDYSAALRTIPSERVSAWLDGVRAHRTPTSEEADLLEEATEGIEASIHPRFRSGLAGLITRTLQLETARDQLVKRFQPSDAPAYDISALNDAEVGPALVPLVPKAWRWGSDHVGQVIAEVASRFGAPADAPPFEAQTDVPWFALVGRLRAVATRAVLATTSDAHRTRLLDFLGLLASTPFTGTDLHARFRVVTAEVPPDTKLPIGRGVSSFSHGGRWFASEAPNHHYHLRKRVVQLIEPALDGTFASPTGVNTTAVRALTDGWGTPTDLTALKALLDAHGPVAPPDPTPFIEQTGVSRAEAVLVLAGMPGVDVYEKNFLPKDVRALLGLKVQEAHTARGPLKALAHAVRADLYSKAFTEPAELFDGRWVDNLAKAWVAAFGKRKSVDEAALAAVPKAIRDQLGGSLRATLEVFLDPDSAPGLTVDPVVKLTKDGVHEEPEPAHFTAGVLGHVMHVLPWVCTALPVGHDLRLGAPRVLELVRARLKSGACLFKLADVYKGDRDIDELFASFGGTVLEGGTLADCGTTVVEKSSWSVSLYFRPHLLQSPADAVPLAALCGQWSPDTIHHVALVLEDATEALVRNAARADVPCGAQEADPRVCAPDLVANVAAHHDLSDDEAALYLQTLALVDCTDKNVRAWNGWSAAVLRKRVKGLEAKGLVLEAKRARAGRKHFLPGGWVAQRAPNLPLERWKLPLYSLGEVPDSNQVQGPLAAFLPLVPLADLFRAAWTRVLAGDGPRYEEVQ